MGADEFDRAFKANDLTALVALLRSDQAVQRLEEPQHPWAAAPATVGALAATQLALLSSIAAQNNPQLKVEILNAGAIPPLVELLDPQQADESNHAAATALHALTEELFSPLPPRQPRPPPTHASPAGPHALQEHLASGCSVRGQDCAEIAGAAFAAGALPPLIAHLDSEVAGLRGACASTLRHICMESEVYREAFVELGGMAGRVKQLDAKLHPSGASTEAVLEAVWNLEDVTLDPQGNLLERYAKLALEQGAAEKLEALKESSDNEVSGAVEKVLASFAQISAARAG